MKHQRFPLFLHAVSTINILPSRVRVRGDGGLAVTNNSDVHHPAFLLSCQHSGGSVVGYSFIRFSESVFLFDFLTYLFNCHSFMSLSQHWVLVHNTEYKGVALICCLNATVYFLVMKCHLRVILIQHDRWSSSCLLLLYSFLKYSF